jgi:CheY-like chemotaxis protein
MMIARKSMAKRLIDTADWECRKQNPVASRSPEKQFRLEPEKHCAYNRTREHLLGSNVDAADFSVASLNDRIPILVANSGAGIWLVPFRGISLGSEQTPVDLIYLDGNSVVIDLVESFPTFTASQGGPLAASVLVLPLHTIYSTQTRRGDQLLFCVAAEFNRFLMQLSSSRDKAETAQCVDYGKAPSIHGGSGSRPQSYDSSGQNCLNEDASPLAPSLGLASCGGRRHDRSKKEIKSTKSWWQRWWTPDPPEARRAPRESFRGLAAHFWTGGVPAEHPVRDISLTGLYVVTAERWFPGTVVRMTLTDGGESTDKHSITANLSVVRWGNDGVGLEFVMDKEKGLRRDQTPPSGGIDKKDLNQFLEFARSGKREKETREAHRMVSSSDSEESINGHIDPVFNDFFIGPINSSLLIDSLKDLPRPVRGPGLSSQMSLPHPSPLQSSGVVSPIPPRQRPCILLIDDDYLDIMFLAGTLEEDYEVIFASDGATALTSALHSQPDLILLDVMMPGIDGFEVCRLLKTDNRTKEIPVIFITGLSEAAAETKGINMGAVDYISKPFHPTQLKVGVSMHISARRHGKAKSN